MAGTSVPVDAHGGKIKGGLNVWTWGFSGKKGGAKTPKVYQFKVGD